MIKILWESEVQPRQKKCLELALHPSLISSDCGGTSYTKAICKQWELDLKVGCSVIDARVTQSPHAAGKTVVC